MNYFKFLLITSCLIATFTNTLALASTGEALFHDCNMYIAITDKTYNGNFGIVEAAQPIRCVTYINGMIDMNTLTAAILSKDDNKTGLLFCPPYDGITGEMAVRIVFNYLTNHPEQLSLPGSVLIVKALQGAYPCN